MSTLEYRDGLPRGEYVMTCGTRLRLRDGWEERPADVIGPDDQHPSCRTRAMREAHWQGRWTGGPLQEVVRAIAVEAAPWLEDVRIEGPESVAEAGHVFTLYASNLEYGVLGSGARWSDAAADLAANMEVVQP
jgi:hypothetical protein